MPGAGGDFAGPASHRGDPRKLHLPVDTPGETAEFRLEQVAETAQGGMVLVQPPISAEAPDSSAPAHRGCIAPSHSSRCVRTSGPGMPAPQGFPGGATSGRSDICLLWFGQDGNGFFRMSMTSSFSTSSLRMERISASGSRMCCCSRLARLTCPICSPTAFSQLFRVSLQISKSLVTSRGSHPYSVIIHTAPASNASMCRDGGILFFFCFCSIFLLLSFSFCV